MYSIQAIQHPKGDKNNLHKIYFQVIYNRIKVYAETDFKILKSEFKNSEVINHPNKGKINAKLLSQRNEIESRLLDAIKFDQTITKVLLTEIVKNKKSSSLNVVDFVDRLIQDHKGKFSEGTLKHYKSIANKMDKFCPKIRVTDINEKWLISFEKDLMRKNKINTVWSNMKFVKTILNAALKKGIIDKNPFTTYSMPKYSQNIPEYLTESEIELFADHVLKMANTSHKTAGMYFLLSCYTGYRLSDAKSFDEKMIVDGKIRLRAKKNGQIVSIPIHKKLIPVIDYVKENQLLISEQKTREYIKDLISLVGINKHVKFHTARHSFAMLLMSKGFTVDEVSELIGDTLLISKVYARIDNKILGEKILDKL